MTASSGNFEFDDQRPLVREMDHAIRPGGIRQRELEFVGALRQPVLDDHFHAALAEGAALLLVGQHALQRGHLRGQRGDVLLRGIDDGEPFVQPVEVLAGLLGGVLDRLADAVGDGVEPLGKGLLELGLPVRQHVAHGAHQPGGFGLQPAKLGHAGLVFLGFDPFGFGGLFAASSARRRRRPISMIVTPMMAARMKAQTAAITATTSNGSRPASRSRIRAKVSIRAF